jgi:polyhydroxyalkanoate synthesis regulator phasin
MTLEEEIAEATEMALEMISTSEWEVIYNKREDILDSVIASGKISAEDAALYKSDASAWEEELKYIWDELQTQAKDSDKTKKAKLEEL